MESKDLLIDVSFFEKQQSLFEQVAHGTDFHDGVKKQGTDNFKKLPHELLRPIIDSLISRVAKHEDGQLEKTYSTLAQKDQLSDQDLAGEDALVPFLLEDLYEILIEEELKSAVSAFYRQFGALPQPGHVFSLYAYVEELLQLLYTPAVNEWFNNHPEQESKGYDDPSFAVRSAIESLTYAALDYEFLLSRVTYKVGASYGSGKTGKLTFDFRLCTAPHAQ